MSSAGLLNEASDALLQTEDINEEKDVSTSLDDEEQQQLTAKISHGNDTTQKSGHNDDYQWIIFGDEDQPIQDLLLQQYEAFILHLHHVANTKAELDVYQILAFYAKIATDDRIDNPYLKPFKPLKGVISDKWSNLQIRWLNSYQRVLCQALVCSVLQTIGITIILIATFSAYFTKEKAACDYHSVRWRVDGHLKVLAFLWTSFISLGVSGWIYKARHSGFYKVLLFMKAKEITYPSFVNISILQIGLLINYYVTAACVCGSYILIYSTEGGTQTVDMILQAVALFFVLELDYTIVHKRDFASVHQYFDLYIKANKHKQLPSGSLASSDTIFQRACCYGCKCCKKNDRECCHGESCLQTTLDIFLFILLIIMTSGAVIAPFLIMICW